MKRIFLVFFTILIILPVFASAVMPSLKFNGNKYYLYYSSKSPEAGSYINEYYKNGESYESWTELLAVHHFPNAYSPIDYAKNMSDYLSSMNCPSAVDVDEENNSAVIDFILIDANKMPVIVEFDVFKYQKSPVCGSTAVQYAKRYIIHSNLEVDKVKKTFEKDRLKYISKVKKLEVPDLVTFNIDRGKYSSNEGIIKENIEF